MTPAEIRAVRDAHRVASGDLYGAVGLSKIIDRTQEESNIRASCDELAEVSSQIPDLINTCGYSWITDPESYDMAVEVAYQRRALVMLKNIWVRMPDKVSLVDVISDIVVVQEFATKFGLCSPKIGPKRAGAGRILSISAGFVELATWVFSGLRCWASHAHGWSEDEAGDGGWSMVCMPVPNRVPQPFNHVVSYELIARTLAEEGRDRELYGDNAALLIRESLSELAGATGEIDSSSLYEFEQNSAYMAVEFAIAHELGHALASAGADIDDSANEATAHRLGGVLLKLSAATRIFGWGDDILKDVTQAALGMILFRILLEARQILTTGLLRRSSIAGGHRFEQIDALERGRAAVASGLTSEMILAVRKAGYANDANRLSGLVENSQDFLHDLDLTILALPDSAISKALEIVKSTIH